MGRHCRYLLRSATVIATVTPRTEEVTVLRGQCTAGWTAVLILTLVTACAGSSAPPADSPPADDSAQQAAADPLVRITDPRDEAYVSPEPKVLWREHARGPARLSVERSAASNGIVVYISCSPTSNYTVRQVDDSTQFMSGDCNREFQSFGEFPLTGSGEHLEFELVLPQEVDRWVVVLSSRKRDSQ